MRHAISDRMVCQYRKQGSPPIRVLHSTCRSHVPVRRSACLLACPAEVVSGEVGPSLCPFALITMWVLTPLVPAATQKKGAIAEIPNTLWFLTHGVITLGRPNKGSQTGDADIIVHGDSSVSKIHATLAVTPPSSASELGVVSLTGMDTWHPACMAFHQTDASMQTHHYAPAMSRCHWQ